MYFDRLCYRPNIYVFHDYLVISVSLAMICCSASILVLRSPVYEVCKFGSSVEEFIIAQHAVASKFSFCSAPTYIILLHATFSFGKEAREWIQMAPENLLR